MSESIVTMTWDGIAWANVVAAFVLPILVGLVTKTFTASVYKVLLLTVLNTVQSLLGEAIRTWQEGGTYDLGVALQTLVMALLVSWGAYTNVWKPTRVTEKAQRLGDKTPDHTGDVHGTFHVDDTPGDRTGNAIVDEHGPEYPIDRQDGPNLDDDAHGGRPL